jgi:two-component system, OmpR family, phosphate regulon sensor histidine kinase PhoR
VAAGLFKRSLAMLSAAILAAVLVFAGVGGFILARAYADANEKALGEAAGALAASFPASGLGKAGTAAYVRSAASSGYRVTLIARDGKVLADSEADPATMENHASRPEVAAALSGRTYSSRRRSTTVGE